MCSILGRNRRSHSFLLLLPHLPLLLSPRPRKSRAQVLAPLQPPAITSLIYQDDAASSCNDRVLKFSAPPPRLLHGRHLRLIQQRAMGPAGRGTFVSQLRKMHRWDRFSWERASENSAKHTRAKLLWFKAPRAEWRYVECRGNVNYLLAVCWSKRRLANNDRGRLNGKIRVRVALRFADFKDSAVLLMAKYELLTWHERVTQTPLVVGQREI